MNAVVPTPVIGQKKFKPKIPDLGQIFQFLQKVIFADLDFITLINSKFRGGNDFFNTNHSKIPEIRPITPKSDWYYRRPPLYFFRITHNGIFQSTSSFGELTFLIWLCAICLRTGCPRTRLFWARPSSPQPPLVRKPPANAPRILPARSAAKTPVSLYQFGF